MPITPVVVQQATSSLIQGAFRLVGREFENRTRRKEMEKRFASGRPGIADAAAWAPTPLPAELTEFAAVRRRDPVVAGHERTAASGAAVVHDAVDGDDAEEPVVAAPARALFADVIGHDYEKRLLRQALRSERPRIISVLLVGPPGAGKSLLLDDVRTTPRTLYVTGSTVKPAGLRDAFLDTEDPPRVLVFDEIDKADPDTRDVLLSIMDGHVSRVIAGKPPAERHDLDVRVIAAANSLASLSAPLRSRFVVAQMAAQSEPERRAIIAEFLVRRGNDPHTAAIIADEVARSGGDARDAVQIAAVYDSDPTLATEMLNRMGATDRPPTYGRATPPSLAAHAATSTRTPRRRPVPGAIPPLPQPPVYGVKARTVAAAKKTPPTTPPRKRTRRRAQ